MNYFSASSLVKQSASQIKYLLSHKQVKPLSANIISGTKHQFNSASVMTNKIAEEMRGSYIKGDITIYFCNDVLLDYKLVEIKSIDESRKIEDWYFNSSILQTAFYKSLLLNSNGLLCTPAFRIKEGYQNITRQIDINMPYYLMFGKDHYRIDVLNDKFIINFYLKKIKAILSSWDDVKIFDDKYKFKEYEYLKKALKYNKIAN